MAFTATPTSWLPSWSEDATNITVPIASLTGLTAATADGATGDIRKIVYSFLETIWNKYASLVSADRPGKVTMKKTSTTNDVAATITHTYVITVTTAKADQTVSAE
jgi:hypothetical protein